jgi:hypothetical protein
MRSTTFIPKAWRAASMSIVIAGAIAAGCGAGNLGAGATPNESARLCGESGLATCYGPEITDAPLPTYSKSPNNTPRYSPTPEASCITEHVTVDRIPLTIDSMAESMPAVAAGVFLGYEPARWNTSSGMRPANLDEGAPEIYRPADIAIDEVIRGPLGNSVVAQVDGGQVGCDQYSFDTDPQLQLGKRYAFFLSYALDTTGGFGGVTLFQAWPIDINNLVQTSADGAVPLSRIVETMNSTEPVVTLPPGPLETLVVVETP